MITEKVKNLCRILNADESKIDPDISFTGVSTDSRTIKPNQCFFAIKGQAFDGHDFLEQAIQKKAACCVTQKPYNCDSVPCITTENTITALGQLAAWYRKKYSFKVIAITGSAGKTTTREIIYHCLKNKYKTHRSPKSFNNNIGLPLTILSAQPDTQVLVTEIGANAPGEIAHLSKIANPDIALITNIHPAHLQGFGSIENIIKEKASIAIGLKNGAPVIINGHFKDLIEQTKKITPQIITFGNTDYFDIFSQQLLSMGTKGQITIDNKQINVPLPGSANLENTLAAWAVCKQLGISLNHFQNALNQMPQVEMRLNILQAGPITIIDDSYNANPASMANAVDTLSQLAKNKQKRPVFIAGDMAELGQAASPLHRQLGDITAKKGIKLVLAAGKYANDIILGIKNAKAPNCEHASFKDTDTLCDNLDKFLTPDDIILVKGSRNMRMEKAVKKIAQLFA